MREINEAAERKYREGRKLHGPQWVGEAPHLEAMNEALDKIIYLRLVRQGVSLDCNPDEPETLTDAERTIFQILDRLDEIERESALGLRLLGVLLEGNESWRRLFP
jgi:hypothetical protein